MDGLNTGQTLLIIESLNAETKLWVDIKANLSSFKIFSNNISFTGIKKYLNILEKIRYRFFAPNKQKQKLQKKV